MKTVEQQLKDCLYGKGAYTKEQWEQLSPREKRVVFIVNNKAQQKINLYKQKVMIERSKFLHDVFKSFCESKYSNLIKTVCSDDIKPSASHFCTLPFSELGITKEMLISFLKDEGLIQVR